MRTRMQLGIKQCSYAVGFSLVAALTWRASMLRYCSRATAALRPADGLHRNMLHALLPYSNTILPTKQSPAPVHAITLKSAHCNHAHTGATSRNVVLRMGALRFSR